MAVRFYGGIMDNNDRRIKKRAIRFFDAIGEPSRFSDDEVEDAMLAKKMKVMRVIRFFIALALTVAAVVVFAYYGLNQPTVTVVRPQDGGVDVVKKYHELEAIFALLVVATIGNFMLYVIIDTMIAAHSRLARLFKCILHIGGVVMIALASIICAILFGIEKDISSYSPWIAGLYGMCTIGETLTVLIFYWNERLGRGPKENDPDYIMNNYMSQVDRAQAFSVCYVGVPFVSLAVGYLISVGFAYLGKSVSFFYGWGGLVLCAIAIALSIRIYRSKYRFGKRANKNKTKSNSSTVPPRAESDEGKPEDKGHGEGKKRLSSELSAYANSKFVPVSWELSHNVSNVRWTEALTLLNKDSCFASGRLVLRGKLSCDIRREDNYHGDTVQETLDKVIDNIKAKAEEVLDELSAAYSNYNQNYTVDCSGVKINYKTV